jgi:NTP pyrophosphatase (non-canonical NTP hydrolase)
VDEAGDSLGALQREALAFRDARAWAPFHRPKDLVLGLSIEAAELAELLLWKDEREADAYLGSAEGRRRAGEEMADCLLFLLYLAERTGVSLADATRAKLELNARKYPVERSRGSARKYDDPG